MSRFVDKLAGALGFTTDEADDRDNGYDDDYDEYEENDGYSSRSSSRYERGNSSYRSNVGNYNTGSSYSRSASRSDVNSGFAGFNAGGNSGNSYAGSDYASDNRGGYSRSNYSAPNFSRTETSAQAGPNYRTMGYKTSSSTAANGSKVLNLNASVQMEVVVASPESFDEARMIAQSIKDNKPVIINLEFVEHSVAQRMTDFLCGCCCAVDGNIQRIADKIFMIAPGNVDFAGDVDIRQSLQTEGLAFPVGNAQQ